MKILSVTAIMFLWGCSHSPSAKNGIKNDSTTHTLVVEDKTDSLAVEYPAYKPFKEFKKDTLGYLRSNFAERKGYYQSKYMSALLKDIEIPVHHFVTMIRNSPPYKISKYGVYLYFESGGSYLNKMDRRQVPNVLLIVTEDTLNEEEIRPMLRRARSQSEWTKEIADFYGDKIVKDVMVMEEYPPRPKKIKKQEKKLN